ncbi:MAG: hypothetical protein ACREIF_19570 [Chthoniobacterales bacterium]
MKKELYLGLDVHKDSIARAVAEEGRRGEVRDTGVISNDLAAVEKWIARLRKAHGKETHLRACYEAGPCGFGLARRLRQLNVECEVAAPSAGFGRCNGGWFLKSDYELLLRGANGMIQLRQVSPRNIRREVASTRHSRPARASAGAPLQSRRRCSSPA